jgi:opacity protein-like surface antigen
VKTTGYNLSLVAIAPLAQGWSVYGKGGFFDAKTEFEANSGGLVTTSSDSHKSNNGTFGLGAGYEFTKNISANLEWNRYLKIGDASTSKADIDLVTLGLQFKF